MSMPHGKNVIWRFYVFGFTEIFSLTLLQRKCGDFTEIFFNESYKISLNFPKKYKKIEIFHRHFMRSESETYTKI